MSSTGITVILFSDIRSRSIRVSSCCVRIEWFVRLIGVSILVSSLSFCFYSLQVWVIFVGIGIDEIVIVDCRVLRWSSCVLDSKFLGGDKIKQFSVLFLLNRGECMNNSCSCLDLKVKGSRCSRSSSKVDGTDLFKSDMNRRFVNKDESSIKRIKRTTVTLVRATDNWQLEFTTESFWWQSNLSLNESLDHFSKDVYSRAFQFLFNANKLVLHFFCDIQLLFDVIVIFVEVKDEEMISCLSLFNRRIQWKYEEYLSAISVRESEQSQDSRERNLVVKSLSVQLNKSREELDIISSSWSQGNNFLEGYDSISSRLNDVCLCHDWINEGLHRIFCLRICRIRDVEPKFHERDCSIVILIKFHGNLILGWRAVRDVVQWNFESRSLVNVESHGISVEVSNSPIPSFKTELLFLHVDSVSFLKEVGELLLVIFGKTSESIETSCSSSHSDSLVRSQSLPVNCLYVACGNVV